MVLTFRPCRTTTSSIAVCACLSAGEGGGSASSGGAARSILRPGCLNQMLLHPRQQSVAIVQSQAERIERRMGIGDRRSYRERRRGSASFHRPNSIRSSRAIPFLPPGLLSSNGSPPMFGTVSSVKSVPFLVPAEYSHQPGSACVTEAATAWRCASRPSPDRPWPLVLTRRSATNHPGCRTVVRLFLLPEVWGDHSFQGLMIATPTPSKSATLRVTTLAPRTRAIAASIRSIVPLGRPVFRRAANTSA